MIMLKNMRRNKASSMYDNTIMWEKVRCILNRAYVVLRLKQPSGINIQMITYVGHYIEMWFIVDISWMIIHHIELL